MQYYTLVRILGGSFRETENVLLVLCFTACFVRRVAPRDVARGSWYGRLSEEYGQPDRMPRREAPRDTDFSSMFRPFDKADVLRTY